MRNKNRQSVPPRDRAVLDRLPLARHGEQLCDFADCAGLIENLDLVISVDTAVVHLAGRRVPCVNGWRRCRQQTIG